MKGDCRAYGEAADHVPVDHLSQTSVLYTQVTTQSKTAGPGTSNCDPPEEKKLPSP